MEPTQQQSYFPSNYAYKPLNVTQNKVIEQKDISTYKSPQYQSSIQSYQPNQQSSQAYQTPTQIYQPSNDTAKNQRNGQQSPQVYHYVSGNPVNSVNSQVKSYSPYFSNVRPAGSAQPPQALEVKANSVYQTYTYSGFPAQRSQSPSMRPVNLNDTSNYIKINTNYVSPL